MKVSNTFTVEPPERCQNCDHCRVLNRAGMVMWIYCEVPDIDVNDWNNCTNYMKPKED